MRVFSSMALAVIALGLISAPTRAFAQQPPQSQFEHIEELQPLVGIWQANPPKEGEVPMVLSSRLIMNRSYLRLDMSTPTLDGPVPMAMLLIGRDFAKHQVSAWGFFGDNQASGKVKVGKGTASWRQTGVRNSGAKSTESVTIKVDGDKLTVDITDIKYGNNTPPDMHFVFTRSQQRVGRRGGR